MKKQIRKSMKYTERGKAGGARRLTPTNSREASRLPTRTVNKSMMPAQRHQPRSKRAIRNTAIFSSITRGSASFSSGSSTLGMANSKRSRNDVNSETTTMAAWHRAMKQRRYRMKKRSMSTCLSIELFDGGAGREHLLFPRTGDNVPHG